jgi:hypothetical protein
MYVYMYVYIYCEINEDNRDLTRTKKTKETSCVFGSLLGPFVYVCVCVCKRSHLFLFIFVCVCVCVFVAVCTFGCSSYCHAVVQGGSRCVPARLALKRDHWDKCAFESRL